MINQYNSIYGEHIEQFINLKRKCGYKYVEGEIFLSKIDILAIATKQISKGITEAFAEMWCKKRPHESVRYQRKRISHLVHFSSYLASMGIKTHIPRLPHLPRSTFTPYIYSPQEINALFAASDSLRVKQLYMKSCLICLPVLLRLLYSTGIRLGEALALQEIDTDLQAQCLTIKDSKNGKKRIIPISQSLADVFTTYLKYKRQVPSQIKSSKYLFAKLDGGPFQKQVVGKLFRRCLDDAGVPYIGRMQGPRVHDLRHTFAVTSLAGMAQSGIDLYVSLPILSGYLGHQSIDATNKYVRLTANMYPDLIRNVDLICLDVFPKK